MSKSQIYIEKMTKLSDNLVVTEEKQLESLFF